MIYKIGLIVLLHNKSVSSSQAHSPLVLTVHLNRMRVVGPFQSSGQPGKGSLETSFWRENDNICRVWLCTAPQVGCLLIHWCSPVSHLCLFYVYWRWGQTLWDHLCKAHLALLRADCCWPLLFFLTQQKYLARQVIQTVFFLYLTFVFCSQGISSFYRSERRIRSDKPLSRAPFSLLHSLPLMPARFVSRQKVRVQFFLFIPFPVQLKKLSSCVCADPFLFVPLWEL